MRHTWVAIEAVLAAHDELLAEHGGSPGIRDLGLLESALARPLNLASYGDPDPAALAASYAAGICFNHPMVDGNKRAAWSCAMAFLDLNGYDLEADVPEAYAAMIALATREIDETEFAAWLRDRIRRKAIGP